MTDQIIKSLRLDHWFKNIFIIPGFLASFFFIGNYENLSENLLNLFLCLLSSSLAASSNYLINEHLDSKYDKFHPIKKKRSFVKKKISLFLLLSVYFLLVTSSFLLIIGFNFFYKITLFLFIVSGWFYNIPPIRTKDKPYLDIISESFNNVIRFLLGWFILIDTIFPPSSLLIVFWTGGAFLMTMKRYAEYKYLNDKQLAFKYRKSFKYYDESILLCLSFFFAMCVPFFLGIFLIKYKIEFILTFPFIVGLFTVYFRLGLSKNSIAQTPEKLYRSKELILLIFLIIFTSIYALQNRLNFLNIFLAPIEL